MNTSWKESRFLQVVLTPEEVLARGEQLADAIRRRDQLEAKHKAEREQMKEALELAEGEIGKLAKIVNEHQETRAVDVECSLNVTLRLVEEKRLDTGQVIKTREADAKDKLRLQGTLPLEDEPRPAKEERPDPPAETQP
jgi:hypothetical protein